LEEKIKREGKKRIWKEREMEIRKKNKKKETMRASLFLLFFKRKGALREYTLNSNNL